MSSDGMPMVNMANSMRLMPNGANGGRGYVDSLTGLNLDADLVQTAMEKELKYFEDKSVWKIVPTAYAKSVSHRDPISVRWVHTNKGDDLSPNLRARLVAREIRHNGEEPIFAPTPPLEGFRTVLSLAATRLPCQSPRCRDPP